MLFTSSEISRYFKHQHLLSPIKYAYPWILMWMVNYNHDIRHNVLTDDENDILYISGLFFSFMKQALHC